MSAPSWIKILFPKDGDEQALRWWRITVSLAMIAGVLAGIYAAAWGSDKEGRVDRLEQVVERIDTRLGRLENSSDRNLELSLITALRGLIEVRCRTTSPHDIRALEAAIDRHMTEYRNLTDTPFPRPDCPRQTQ